MNKSVSLRVLAKKAGVHYATVSRALRNDPHLPEQTRKRINTLAKAEGYEPSALGARYMASLRRGKSGMASEVLGVLTNSIRLGEGSEHFKSFYRTITNRAKELGYRIDELWLGEPGMTAKRLNKIIHTRGIEGVIVPPTFATPGGHLSLDLSRVAAVQHTHALWRPHLHRVEPHNFQNMLTVLRQLHRLKYRRIGLLLLWGLDLATGHEWEGAYHYHHASHPELEKIPILNFNGNLKDPIILDWVRDNHIDVVVGAYEEHIMHFKKNGFGVPEDLGLVSTSVNSWELPMAGLDIRAEEVDRTAVDMVVDQIHRHERGIPKIPRQTLIEGVWKNGPTVRQIQK